MRRCGRRQTPATRRRGLIAEQQASRIRQVKVIYFIHLLPRSLVLPTRKSMLYLRLRIYYLLLSLVRACQFASCAATWSGILCLPTSFHFGLDQLERSASRPFG